MKVLIAGDYCEKYRVSECISKGEYATMFDEVKPIINKVDISIVNFEFPVVQNDAKPITKCGPNLKGQPKAVEAIKYAGFNVCTLANNHIMDQGEKACLNTKSLIEQAGLHTVGVGKNAHEASTTLYMKCDNKTLAIINCCEHEFSVATKNTAGANPLNPVQQYYQIQAARKNADFILIIVHGGHELFQLPSLRMKETYRFFIDSGADAVVNHHQHCFSGYELYNGKPIFYGLGNFLFDHLTHRHTICNEGYMVTIDFEKQIAFEFHPYNQCNELPKITLVEGVEKEAFLRKVQDLNKLISNDQLLSERLIEYYNKCKKSELRLLDPYPGKLLKKLNAIGLLPNLMKGKNAVYLLNHIECEAHKDKLSFALKSIIKNR